MRRLSYLFLLLSTFGLCRLNAAEVVVPGVSGITFDDAVPSATITQDFTVEGLTITPQGLTLTYASDVFKLFGAAIVKLGTDEITVSFGTESNPGLQVTSGNLDLVSMGVTADFELKSLTFSPAGLSFEWDNVNDIFEIFGDASVSFDSETMSVGLGTTDAPGIEITSGDVTKIDLSVSADFNIKSLGFSPDALTFQWDSTTDKFEMFGGADVSFDSETMTIGLGDADTPGIEINAGTVEKVNLSVSADFNIKSLAFSPDALTFQWDSTTDKFEMFGGADVSFDSETMTIGLGDADTPGIEINAGTVEKVNLSVSADFNIKSLAFSPDALTFQWDSTTDKFEMFGGADVSFDSETMTIGLGDADTPGIEINAGTVEKVNLSVSADFNIKSLAFSPDALTFQWDSTTDKFEMFGGADVSFDSETMTIGLGDADTPGIEINAGTVEKVNLSVSADFNIKSLAFSPDALTFQWDSTTDKFEMFGGADVSFDSETMTIGLGDADTPGIEINAGTVEKVNLSVSADFNIKSLAFSPDALTFQWDSTTDKFEMFGGADVSFDSETMTIGLGDADTPGIEINGGTVEKVNLSVSADFNIKSLAFSPDALTFQWDSTTDKFEMFGGADVSFDSETMTIGLGDADTPGIEINGGTVEKVNLSVSADFNIKSLAFSPDALTFQWDSTTDKFEMFGGADVSFDSETMTIGLGDADTPGIEINGGTVEKVNLSVSANFNMKSLLFRPQGLTFQWDSSSDEFEMFGNLEVTFDSETILANLGSADEPGLAISGGVVQKINFGLRASFEVKDLLFRHENLNFHWDKAADRFEIYGNTEVSFDSENILVSMGSDADPGIRIVGGAVDHLNLGVSANFNMKSIEFHASGLTFQWDKASDHVEIFGNTSVTFDGETISVALGNDANPGVRVDGGVIDHINMGISADFNMKSIDFKAEGLTFEWDKASDHFEIYGNTSVTFDSETVAISLGSSSNPGIRIDGGLVDHINMGITADFTLRSISFAVDALTFEWDKAGDYFELYGVAEATFDGETARVALGTSSNPGVKIENNELQHINMSVLGTFDMKGISFTAEDLGFVWDKSSNHFLIFGGASATFDSETVSVLMGNSSDPGVRIVNNVIQYINMGITADFTLKDMSFTADGLTFEWDSAEDHFEIYGSASATFDGETLSVLLGNASDPGIVIDNDEVQHINMGITADFSLKTMEFEADGLTFHWDKSSGRFEIFGSTTAKFDGEEVSISLGSDSNPGIAVQNNVIQHINMGVTANINLKAMTIKPDALTFQYDHSSRHFEMFGSADLTVEGHDAGVSMGDDSDPGLVFTNGELKHINMAITEDFTLKGLTIKTDNLGVEWSKGTNHYNFYGDMELDIANESINADMGTSGNPGMQFRNGSLHSMDITVNSDFKIGNLEVTTRDVEVKYTDSKFYMTGEIEVDEVWSVIVDLGEDGSNGLEIDASHHPDKLKLTDFKIEVDHVDLGAIDFKKVEISFKNDVIHEAELDVSIPPGYEVDATMTFEGSPAKLNSIDISFDATNFDTAIPIGDTGIELVHIEGGMFNLADPSQEVTIYETIFPGFTIPLWKTTGVYFEGSVAFTFGGPVSLAGHEAALIYQEDDVTITGSGVYLNASLLIGAYRHSHNSWRSILGDGSISMNLLWGRSYSVSAHMKIPSDPLVEFDAGAKLSASGNFDALIDVKLKVPHSVPIVGGKTLGSVDGGIRYNPHHLSSSYGAGWASYWFFGRHHFGARYKFSNRHVDVIGSGTVSSIQRDIRNELGSRANLDNSLRGTANTGNGIDGSHGVEETVWVKDVRTFEIPPNKTSIFVELDMGQQVDEAYVSVIGPDGFYDIYEIEKTEVAEDEPPLMELQDRITKFEADSAANFLIINHEPEDDSLQHQFSTMTPGQYDLLISYKESNNVDSVGVRINYFHPVSFGDITAEKRADGLVDIDMEYWAQFPDSTQLSVFWNDTAAYAGEHIGTLDYGIPDENGFAETSLTFNPKNVVDGDSLYFYFVLQDSSNAPVYSNLTPYIKHNSPVAGTINITNGDEETVLGGLMVFIDENGDGFYDTEGTGGAFEPSSITDLEGKFHFNNLVVGQTYTIDVVVPFGYSLAADETGARTFTYTGVAQTFTFNLIKD